MLSSLIAKLAYNLLNLIDMDTRALHNASMFFYYFFLMFVTY